jgi:hypothetical protein
MFWVTVLVLGIGIGASIIRQLRNLHAPGEEISPDEVLDAELDRRARHQPVPVPEREWIPRLASMPLLFIKGGMNAGKTTFAHALVSAALTADRQAMVCIINPKAETQHWWGMQTVTIDDDLSFRHIACTLSALSQALRVRQRDAKYGRKHHPLLVVIDDLPDVARNCGADLAALVEPASTIGRTLGIRLILLSHSNRAGKTGFRGLHDVLLDAPCVALHERQAMLSHGEQTWHLDTRRVPNLARRKVDADRVWIPVPAPDEGDVEGDTGTGSGGGIADTDAVSAGIDEDALIAALVERGASANSIHKLIGGNRNEVLERVRVLRGGTNE